MIIYDYFLLTTVTSTMKLLANWYRELRRLTIQILNSEKIRCTLTGRKNSAEFTIGDGESCHFTYWLINLLGLNGEIVIKSRAGELLLRLLLHRRSNSCKV